MLKMSLPQNDTIAARATPSGYAGIGVIRISGKRSQFVARHILGEVPPVRKASFFAFKGKENVLLDKGIAIFFKAPSSFTGEDVLELQGHGGPVVLDMLLEYVLRLDVRAARPGEFSERAFLNGKMDLVQAEAIADLIHAPTREAARSASLSLQGAFSDRIRDIQSALTQLRMQIEASIDFPEDEIADRSESVVLTALNDLIAQVMLVKKTAKQGVLLFEGVTVAIVGEPNVGKSSLLNYLSGSTRAIVTNIPGTTRDILKEQIVIDGLPIQILDTAGLRETHDLVEQEGVKLAKQMMGIADVVLFMFSVDLPSNDGVATVLSKWFENETDLSKVLLVKNKMDLLGNKLHESHDLDATIPISVKTGAGMEVLQDRLKEKVGFVSNEEGLFMARRRHLDMVNRVEEKLIYAKTSFVSTPAIELLAEDLFHAQHFLSEILGGGSNQELLNNIFSTFCIGK